MKGLDQIQAMNVDAEDIENAANFYIAVRMTQEDFVDSMNGNFADIWNAFTAWQVAPAREAPVTTREPVPRDPEIPEPTLPQIDAARLVANNARRVKEGSAAYWRGGVADGDFDTFIFDAINQLGASIGAFPASA